MKVFVTLREALDQCSNLRKAGKGSSLQIVQRQFVERIRLLEFWRRARVPRQDRPRLVDKAIRSHVARVHNGYLVTTAHGTDVVVGRANQRSTESN